MDDKKFQELVWQKGHELFRPMPWRTSTKPYHILVSEIMLQQTQVGRVIPKFNAFIGQFPDASSLAASPLAIVLTAWSGLGYNRRAKYLHEAAKCITEQYGGLFPQNPTDLTRLPGVGPNTAGAMLAYAFNQPALFVETNIRTVYLHHFFTRKEKVSDQEIRSVLERTLDREKPRQFYWALMDYGSFLKMDGAGQITRSLHYRKQTPLAGSVRQIRGQVVKLLAEGEVDERELVDRYAGDGRLTLALIGLLRDGLIERQGSMFYLTGSIQLEDNNRT